MGVVDFSHEPRPQMVEVTLLVPEVSLDVFGGCHFLEFGQEVRLVESVQLGIHSFLELFFLSERGFGFLLHGLI